MKKGYWISLYTKVENQENLKRYAETITPIIKSFGGVPLIRGINIKHLTVIILFGQLCGNFKITIKQLSVIIQRNIELVGI
jgi:hypothetical protein